jgi:hypothetical protein
MIAKVFGAYVAGRIDVKTLHRLNNTIDRLPFYEIDTVRKLDTTSKDGKFDAGEDTRHALENAGLIYAASGYGALVYKPTDLCQVFLELELDRTRT